MKILMLLENEFRKDGRVEKEIKTLHENGHEVIVAALSHSDLPLFEKRKDCTVVRKRMSAFIRKSGVGALKFPYYFNFWRKFTRENVNKFRPDAIHVHDLPLARVGIEMREYFNVRFVLDLHENWPALLSVSSHTNTLLGKLLSSEKQWREYEKKCTESADAIITVVEEMKKRIARTGAAEGKIFVLENTPLLNSIRAINFQRDTDFYTLIYVGGISFHRGVQYAIKGLGFVKEEIPVRLWIAGEGKYLTVLKKMADELNLGEKITFWGHVAQPEDLLIKADAGLIPHIRSEQSDNSSPNKLYEYMAAGLPVIASDCTSLKRAVEESETGKTYFYNSAEDFARAVEDLYKDRANTARYSENGKRWVREKHNWETSSQNLVKLYSDLSNGNRTK